MCSKISRLSLKRICVNKSPNCQNVRLEIFVVFSKGSGFMHLLVWGQKLNKKWVKSTSKQICSCRNHSISKEMNFWLSLLLKKTHIFFSSRSPIVVKHDIYFDKKKASQTSVSAVPLNAIILSTSIYDRVLLNVCHFHQPHS